MPAVSPMSAAPTGDTEKNKKKKQKRANLKLRLAYGVIRPNIANTIENSDANFMDYLTETTKTGKRF